MSVGYGIKSKKANKQQQNKTKSPPLSLSLFLSLLFKYIKKRRFRPMCLNVCMWMSVCVCVCVSVKNRCLKVTKPQHGREQCHFVLGSLCLWRHEQGGMCSKSVTSRVITSLAFFIFYLFFVCCLLRSAHVKSSPRAFFYQSQLLWNDQPYSYHS